MIGLALKLLRDELSNYIFQDTTTNEVLSMGPDDIILHNIAAIDGDTQGSLSNKIVISLVNTEEESTLKNTSHIAGTMNGLKYAEPPVYLNLYILICATLGQAHKDAYELALRRLSLVIQFFQTKKHFTVKNSPFTSISSDTTINQEIKDDLKLNVELYTLTFEQINHLWGSLGGKQMPFAMYKIRLIQINEGASIIAPPIEEIHTYKTLTNDS